MGVSRRFGFAAHPSHPKIRTHDAVDSMHALSKRKGNKYLLFRISKNASPTQNIKTFHASRSIGYSDGTANCIIFIGHGSAWPCNTADALGLVGWVRGRGASPARPQTLIKQQIKTMKTSSPLCFLFLHLFLIS